MHWCLCVCLGRLSFTKLSVCLLVHVCEYVSGVCVWCGESALVRACVSGSVEVEVHQAVCVCLSVRLSVCVVHVHMCESVTSVVTSLCALPTKMKGIGI